MLTIIIVLSFVIAGILIFKFNAKGKAIGTIIIFAILAIYLLLKYVLHLF